MLLLGKTQKKHMGDLPPTVPDLPSTRQMLTFRDFINFSVLHNLPILQVSRKFTQNLWSYPIHKQSNRQRYNITPVAYTQVIRLI